MVERRTILRDMLILGAAPAIVRAASLMLIRPSLVPIKPPPPGHWPWAKLGSSEVLYTPSEHYGDELGCGNLVFNPTSKIVRVGWGVTLLPGEERVISKLMFPLGNERVRAFAQRINERRRVEGKAPLGCA